MYAIRSYYALNAKGSENNKPINKPCKAQLNFKLLIPIAKPINVLLKIICNLILQIRNNFV